MLYVAPAGGVTSLKETAIDNAAACGICSPRHDSTARPGMAVSALTQATTKPRQGRMRPALSWTLIVAIVASLRALGDRLALLNDPDTYLHIAAGRWMLAHGVLPQQDPFSHTMAGAPWLAHEWLAELVLALIYGWSGWAGVALLTAVCFALALALLTRSLLVRCEPFSALILVGFSGALILPHLLARPHALALPLLAAWCAALVRARDGGTAPPLLVLPVMTLWANLHGSFIVGLALAAFLGAEAAFAAPAGTARRASVIRWGAFLVLATGAALITPHGIDGLLLPFRLSAMPALQQSFIEWMSPNFQSFQPFEAWLLSLMFVAFAFGLRLPVARLVLLLALIHLALAHVRHVDLAALLAPVIVAAPLGPQIAERIRSSPPSPLGGWFIALARPANAAGRVLAAVLLLAMGTASLLRPLERPDGPETPAAALAAARRMGLSGPVFNSEGFGGYLVFSGVPTFIDGRIEMYGDAFLRRYFAAESGDADALADLLERYHIAWTLLHPGERAASILDHLPGWQRRYADGQAIIHVRTQPLAR